MDRIKCLVCGGKHFQKVEYQIDTTVETFPEVHGDDDVEVFVDTKAETDMTLTIEPYGDYVQIYKYACRGCGFIMSFIEDKKL